MHYVNRDSLGLANDFLSLGFSTEGDDIKSVADALQEAFADGTRQSQDFQVCAYGVYTIPSKSCGQLCNLHIYVYIYILNMRLV